MKEELTNKVLKRAEELEDQIIKSRRKIHQNPELSYEEKETSEYIIKKLKELEVPHESNYGNLEDIKKELKGLGIEFNDKMEAYGVLGTIKGKKSGKTVLLRADMDALPIKESNEETHLPKKKGFRSKKEGLMHACGHDAHTAMLLGATKIINEIKDQFNGEIKVLFQPAEEKGNGAKIMKKAGVLNDVDAVYGLHVWSNLQKGKIEINEGPMMASDDMIKISVKGGGGHGSTPHETKDPISTSFDIVNTIYKYLNREIDTRNPSVFTVTKFQGGSTWNVIPNEVEMEGTIRTFDPEVRKKIVKRAKEIGNAISELNNLEFDFEDIYLDPPVVNTEKEAKIARKAAKKIVKEENVITNPPSMGAEDFAHYLTDKPGAFIKIGSKNPEKNNSGPHHNEKFDLDESILKNGTALYVLTALEFLET